MADVPVEAEAVEFGADCAVVDLLVVADLVPPRHARGYGKLFHDQVTQAPDGCDFRFLEAGPPPPEPDIF